MTLMKSSGAVQFAGPFNFVGVSTRALDKCPPRRAQNETHGHRGRDAPTEALNLLIKKIKRVAHGLRNFDNYRPRVMPHTGSCNLNYLGH
jgi:transposase